VSVLDATPLHALRPADVYPAMETSPDGLSEGEPRARLSLYGPNVLTAAPRVPLWRQFLAHTTHLMALLLWVAGLAAILGGQPTLGVVIWIVVLINAGFSFWEQYRAERAMEALSRLLPTYTRVIRSGVEQQVEARDLVPGDVLVLAEGDNIPADARVVEEFGLRTNNTTLTGEAMPARKTAEPALRGDRTELERPNLVFAGTSVVSGTARAVVYATGMLTQFGRIARLTQSVHEPPSALTLELRRLNRIIAVIASLLGIVVFVVGEAEVGLPRLDAFLLAIGMVVAVVPEGLTPLVTLTLAIAVQRLGQRGVLVRKLATMETLGSVSVVCTDKSGTLTQNQMTIRSIWLAGRTLTVTGVGYDPRGEIHPPPEGMLAQDLELLLTAASLCNNSRLDPPSPERPTWNCLGDQTEAAMRVLARKGGLDEERLAAALPRVHELPFDARRKRMTTIHRVGREEIAFVKGAPREVLQLCARYQRDGVDLPLEPGVAAAILEANDAFARSSLRVLALARRQLPPRTGPYTVEDVERDLTFLGLVAMMDPPRPEVAEAIRRCQGGGIRMVMITGDYGLTAESVARRIGMLTSPQPRILTGAELDAMQDAELRDLVRSHEVVFARMAPEHKLRLVACFQELGEVVAVIGDGVNDAPALRKADIGIAMGRIGTDVAKEAADLVLTNDDFSGISLAMEEGRAVYDNLRKSSAYVFASNVPEILPFILTAQLGFPLALGVAQILAIDLGTDIFPALALGAEPPESDVMQRPPRRRNARLLDTRLYLRAFLWLGMIEAGLCFGGFALVYNAFGYGHLLGLPAWPWLPRPGPPWLPEGAVHALASTVFFAGVVMAQIGNAFACRTERRRAPRSAWRSNRALVYGVAAELIIALALIYLPGLRSAFGMVALPLAAWAGITFFAPAMYILDWTSKSVMRLLDGLRAEEGGRPQ
jgi:P-type Ca2+ transporter type 2C